MDAGKGKEEAEGAEARGRNEKRDGAEAGAGKIGIGGHERLMRRRMDAGNGKEEAEGKQGGGYTRGRLAHQDRCSRPIR